MADSTAPAEAFARAVRILGSQAKAAKVCGVTQGAVWQRLKAKKPAADKWIAKLEEATGVSRHDLGPDIYGPRPALLDDSPAYERAR